MKQLKLYGDRIITGAGAIDYLKTIEGQRVILVIGGQSTKKNGTLEHVMALLSEAGKTVDVIGGVPKNPDTDIVLSGVEIMKTFKPDTVVAIGGGSPIDAAKVMTLMYEQAQLSFDTILNTDISRMQLETNFIAVPTTSGTGTEVTKAAVITFREQNIKIGLKSEAFIPKVALLDANLTMSMPPNIVAETGLDALTHALECYINHNLDDYTECLAKGAIEGLLKYLPLSYEENTLEAREKVHNYQNIAGMAFHNVGLGMAHGISHAFGGQYDMGHGLLNGICLPYVMDFNRKDQLVNRKLTYLEGVLNCDDLVQVIHDLNKRVGIPTSFQKTGLSEEAFKEDFDKLVENSLKGSTVRNPVQISRLEMETLLELIYYGQS